MSVLKKPLLKPINSLFLLLIFLVSCLFFTKVINTYWDRKHLCDNAYTYWSLSEALKKPEVVCILHLHNDDSAISEDILKLKNLKILHLHMNHLKEVPIFLRKLPHLSELAIDGYQFEDRYKKIQAEFPSVIVVLDYSHPPHDDPHDSNHILIRGLQDNQRVP